MPFEINLPSRLDVCLLRCAGMETDAYLDRTMAVITDDAPVPFEVELPYFLSDPAAKVRVTMLGKGNAARLRIAAPTPAVERAIRKYLERYSAENDGEAVVEREDKAVWKQIGAILKREKLSYDKLRRREGKLNRRAIESLIELAQKIEPQQVSNIYELFANGPVERADQELAVRWLIKLFADTRDNFERGQISLRIWENTIPKVADDIAKLLSDKRYGESRAALCMAIAKAKHPRAADVIASVLHQDCMAWAGVQALARLKATHHADKIRRCLRNPDSDVRRQAKKALAKLGFPVETPPAPVHVVKGRRAIPKGLEEWSQNLDMDDLEPIVEKLATCVEDGFAKQEIAEVVGVANEMHEEQTKALRFPVRAGGKRSELWIVIFMDDIDSPDFEVHAAAEVVERFQSLVEPR